MKRFFKTVILCALFVVSTTECMDNQIEVENIPSTELIGFTATTTRAVSVDLPVIKNDATGYRVFATGGNAPVKWYADENANAIDGTNHHRYDGNKWSFTNPVKWPKDAGDYPLKFYAVYPAVSAGFLPFNTAFNPTMLAAFYVVPNVGKQEDVMAARTTAARQPASGTVGLVFHHILSKINFGIIAGTGTVPMIQSVQVENAHNKRAFDFVGGDWFGPTDPVVASYLYYGEKPVGGGAIPVFTPAIRNETTANPIYAGIHGNHLMLLPQTTPSWKPVSGTKPTTTSGGYVCLIYRMNPETAGEPELVGMDDATQHPDWLTLGNGYTGPLFVKVGFPFPSTGGNFTWDKGQGYMYNIILGTYNSSNGFIIDENYYDENGDRTNLPLDVIRDEIKKPGDPLNDGKIHFRLDVSDWDAEVETNLP